MSAGGGAPELLEVKPAQWLKRLRELRDAGRGYFDFLAATDVGDGRSEVVAHVMRPDAEGRVLVRTVVESGEPLASLTSLFPAAAWHEREAHEFLGVEFLGNPDLRPLLLPPDAAEPLRRDFPLTARVDRTWPGTADPGVDPASPKRRRPRPVPGVREQWRESEPGAASRSQP